MSTSSKGNGLGAGTFKVNPAFSETVNTLRELGVSQPELQAGYSYMRSKDFPQVVEEFCARLPKEIRARPTLLVTLSDRMSADPAAAHFPIVALNGTGATGTTGKDGVQAIEMWAVTSELAQRLRKTTAGELSSDQLDGACKDLASTGFSRDILNSQSESKFVAQVNKSWRTFCRHARSNTNRR